MAQRLRQSLCSGQPAGAVGAIREDGVPGIAYPTEVLAGPVGSARRSNDLVSTGGDHNTRVVLQLSVYLGDRLGEATRVPDQADWIAGRRHERFLYLVWWDDVQLLHRRSAQSVGEVQPSVYPEP